MLAKEIKSLQHPLIKHAVKLRENHQYRNEQNLVVVAGKKLVFELGKKEEILQLFISEDFSNFDQLKPKEVYFVTPEIMKKITNLQNPEPIAAVLPLPKTQKFIKKEHILLLDHISDPGNLGTIIRSAYALKWDGIILTKETVDPFNDKAIRSAMGATFNIPLKIMEDAEIKEFIEKNKMLVYVADIDGENFENQKYKTPMILALGSESSGPSTFMKNLGVKITIPMHEMADSLNVATSSAILLYFLRK